MNILFRQKDEAAGEVPVAFVVRSKGVEVSEEAAKEFIAKQVIVSAVIYNLVIY